MAAEVGGGLLFGAAGAGLAWAIWAARSDCEGFLCNFDDFFLAWSVGITAVTFGVPGGVTLFGDQLGGAGGYGWSLLGSVLGTLAGTLLTMPMYAFDGPPYELIWGGMALSHLAGAVVGYEASSD